jgi:hypothetical protein
MQIRWRDACDPEIDFHFPSSDQKVLDFSNVLSHVNARDHREQYVKPDDRTINPRREVCHLHCIIRVLMVR